MKKFIGIANIIIYFIITTISICSLIPAESGLGNLIYKILKCVNDNVLLSNFASFIIIVLGATLLVVCIYDFCKIGKKHHLEFGSKKYCKFFSKWYKKPGRLSIICDDLNDWVIFDNNRDIYDALKEKSKKGKLDLYLRKQEPIEVVDELKQLGAVLHIAPEEIVSNYSFSCISVMGNYSAVIIRDKHIVKSTEIVFDEVNDSYVTNLLNTLINEI